MQIQIQAQKVQGQYQEHYRDRDRISQLLFMNTQSIRDKDDILSEYMRSEATDVAIATETWLTNNDRDVVWLESNELVKGC